MSSTPNAAGSNAEWNVWAVVAIVTVWFTGILGLVFGYIALSQIKTTGQRGHGLALAAVVLGWISVAAAVVIIGVLLVSGGLYIVNS
jgi:uncharacterized membrane protein